MIGKRKLIKITLVGTLFLSTLSFRVTADVIYFKNKDIIRGEIIEKTAIRKKKTTGSESTYYKYSVTYPEEVSLNEVNDIKLTITNLTTMSDTELAVHNTRYIMEKGEFVSYTKEEKSPFKIIRIEPEPRTIDNFFGITEIYYRGLKAKESKDIILYFKLIKEGTYMCRFTFYTDKYADDENEVVPEINIKCTH